MLNVVNCTHKAPTLVPPSKMFTGQVGIIRNHSKEYVGLYVYMAANGVLYSLTSQYYWTNCHINEDPSFFGIELLPKGTEITLRVE